jgi:hypothetical protein
MAKGWGWYPSFVVRQYMQQIVAALEDASAVSDESAAGGGVKVAAGKREKLL